MVVGVNRRGLQHASWLTGKRAGPRVADYEQSCMTVTSRGGSSELLLDLAALVALFPFCWAFPDSPFMIIISAVVPFGFVVRIRIESTVCGRICRASWWLGLFPAWWVARAAVRAASHAVWNNRALRFASFGTKLPLLSVSVSSWLSALRIGMPSCVWMIARAP